MQFQHGSTFFVLCAWVCSMWGSVATAASPHAASLVPSTTQGFIRVVHLPRFMERFEATELGAMGKVPGMWEFWEEQKQEIEKRLGDAGWRLQLHPQDVYDVASGQVALAWLSRPNDPRKPYAVALVVDVQDKEKEAKALLARIDTDMKASKAKTESLSHAGLTITKYSLPLKAGELIIQEAYYTLANGQIMAADDATTIKSMLDAARAGTGANTLASTEPYQQIQAKLTGSSDTSDVEYFVRPIGLAKVLRSISSKPSGRQVDVLKVLENQGFGKLQAASGRLRFLDDHYDLYHQAFVLAPQPLPKSVQILDFPNKAVKDVPSWISSNTAAVTSLAWNVREAFWKVEGLVDEMSGQKDAFKIMIEGIQQDPLGAQVDIRNEVMTCLTDEILAVNDCLQPITPDSRRSMIAIHITSPEKFAKVLDRIMKIEPNAELVNFKGKPIWKVTRENSDAVSDVSLGNDFGGFGKSTKATTAPKEDEPWLNNWAITVHDNYLLFSSHVDMIQEAIESSKIVKNATPLESEADFKRARQAIAEIVGHDPNCLWHVSRADRAFEMQYELFRQDKLPESRSMLSTILDRLLHSKSEARKSVQRVKGDRLPPFAQIREYLMPSGAVIKTEKDGWLIRSFVLPSPSRIAPKTETASTVQTAEAKDGKSTIEK